jgi:hypothetical protein
MSPLSSFSEPGSARQEAERLVATVLAAATLAANAHPQLSTGSAECCVCPLCKVIAAVRDPDPEMVERVATGAGDLAAGIASFLRTLATPTSDGESAWRDATAEQGRGGTPKKAAPRRAGPKPEAAPRVGAPARKVVKKVAKKVAENKAAKKAAPGAQEG